MPTNKSIVDGTLKEAVDALAWRYMEINELDAPPLTKEAQAKTANVLERIGQFIKSQKAPVLGAVGGAALGGGAGYLASLAEPKKDRDSLRSAITGAISGGALGGGAGLAIHGLRGDPKLQEDIANAREYLQGVENAKAPGIGSSLFGFGRDWFPAATGAIPVGAAGYEAHRALSKKPLFGSFSKNPLSSRLKRYGGISALTAATVDPFIWWLKQRQAAKDALIPSADQAQAVKNLQARGML